MNAPYSKRVQRAWSFYDWANSVYALVISTAIFPIFYNEVTKTNVQVVRDKVLGEDVEVAVVEAFGMEFVNTELYSYAISFSLLLVALLSPLLSGIADYAGKKKFFLKVFCYLGSVACMALWWFDPQRLELSMLVLVLASMGYWSSLVFYNSYLPDIAPKAEHDQLSARGFAMGYVGSVILLVINLIMVQVFDIDARWCFLMVGVWWLGFAQITLRRIPDNPYNHKGQGKLITKGFEELRMVFWDAWNARRLWWYLVAFFVLSMGVQTVMLMAQFFGIKAIIRIDENGNEVVGMETGELIVAIILVQLIAIPGAFLFSWMAKKLGNVQSLMVAMCCWIAVCCWAFFAVHTPSEFWAAASCIGFIMGGTQSLSRSTYSKFLPETEDTTSYFSFFDVLEKYGIIIGTFSFGFIEGWTGTIRNSVLALIVFFVIALILLKVVPKEERFLAPREEVKRRRQRQKKRQRGVAAE